MDERVERLDDVAWNGVRGIRRNAGKRGRPRGRSRVGASSLLKGNNTYSRRSHAIV